VVLLHPSLLQLLLPLPHSLLQLLPSVRQASHHQQQPAALLEASLPGQAA
jgi:hypothetical protein